MTTDATPILACKKPASIAFFVLIVAVTLTMDLWVKWWSFNSWPTKPVNITQVIQNQAPLPDIEKSLIPSTLSLKLVLNQGAVFGMGQGKRSFFIFVTIFAVTIISYFFAASFSHQRFLHFCLAMILSGALGNLYDRFMFAAVRDMFWLFPRIELPFGWSWPNMIGGGKEVYPWIFNLADVYLVLGIPLILIYNWLHPTKPIDPKTAESADTPADKK